MKLLSVVTALLLFISCQPGGVEVLRLVNRGNDGWNAFNVSFFSDSSYERSELFMSNKGSYKISGNAIEFKSGIYKGGRLVFDKDSCNCLYNIMLTAKDTTEMRAVFDSLYSIQQTRCDSLYN